MKEKYSAAVGFVVASIIPAGLFSILSLLTGLYGVDGAALLFAVVYLYSAVFILILGVPAFFLLRPFRPGHWWSVSAVGFILGMVVALILRLPNAPNRHDVIVNGLIAALTALVFWLIWRRGTTKGA